MRDKRPVDELSIEELERVLAIRRREDRQKRLGRMKADGRVVESPVPQPPSAKPVVVASPPIPPKPTLTASTFAIQTDTLTLDALDSMLTEQQAGQSLKEAAAPTAPHMPEANPQVIPALSVDAGEVALLDESYSTPEQSLSEHAWRIFVNRALLLVEVAAVLGLVFLGVNLYQAMVDVQRESAEAQALAEAQRRAGIPTPAPTSVIELARLEDFVLPGGHTAAGDFNFDEIYAEVPAEMQLAVIRQVFDINVERPPVTTETAVQVVIEKLGIDATIVQGTDWEALKAGVGQVQNGANPGDDFENVALAAHNDIYGAIFKDLDQLEAGDSIQVQTNSRTFTYRITKTQIVEPTEVSVLDSRGKPTLTLISCYPPGRNDKRIVVFADRVDNFGNQG